MVSIVEYTGPKLAFLGETHENPEFEKAYAFLSNRFKKSEALRLLEGVVRDEYLERAHKLLHPGHSVRLDGSHNFFGIEDTFPYWLAITAMPYLNSWVFIESKMSDERKERAHIKDVKFAEAYWTIYDAVQHWKRKFYSEIDVNHELSAYLDSPIKTGKWDNSPVGENIARYSEYWHEQKFSPKQIKEKALEEFPLGGKIKPADLLRYESEAQDTKEFIHDLLLEMIKDGVKIKKNTVSRKKNSKIISPIRVVTMNG